MNKKKGLRIGNYRITPLGIGTLCALILVAAALILYPIINRGTSKSTDLTVKNSNTPLVEDTPSVVTEPTDKPTPRPSPVPISEPLPREATIRFLGDITIEKNLLYSAADMQTQTFDFSSMFSLINDSISSADYTVANVNGTLGGTASSPSGDEKKITPSSLIDCLKDSGVDMIMAGGRHSMDGGLSELQGTLTNLELAGVEPLGINKTPETAGQARIVDINGIQVGFLGYTENLNGGADRYDNGTLERLNLVTRRNAPSAISEAKQAGAEVIVVVIDWGTRYELTPSTNQGNIATILTNAGADVILGCGPSVIQPLMYVTASDGSGHRSLCLCSAGNLLSDQKDAGKDCGFIFEFALREQDDGTVVIENAKCIPTYVLRYQGSTQFYQYRTLAIGQWINRGNQELLDGMSYADVQRMELYWNRFSQMYGSNAELIVE